MSGEFDVLISAAAGMEAQRSALDVAAHNVALAETTPNGAAFSRLVPHFTTSAEDDEIEEPSDDIPVRFSGTGTERGVEIGRASCRERV